MAYWIRRLTGNPRVPSSIPGRNSLWCGGHGYQIGAKLTVKAPLVIAENTISVGHCVISLTKELVPQISVIRKRLRSTLATHSFDLVEKKKDPIPYYFVLRECQLQTDTLHAKRKWRGIKVGKDKCNLKDD